jgi:hypothetical protein
VSTAEDFLSGTSGQVWGWRRTATALALDALADARAAARLQPWRLGRAAQDTPRRRVLAVGVERENAGSLLASSKRELLSSHHQVEFVTGAAGSRGKFENLNALLDAHPPQQHDWLLVIDDDVALPRHFLDVFLLLTECCDLRVAQPAHRARSHAAWEVTRRRSGCLARQTVYVEIGPVVAFHASTLGVLLPFPPLRAGWGLDLHWSALAREHGWRQGVVDATPVSHIVRRTASAYDRREAIEEAREFLRTRPYTNATDAQRTLATYRSLP